MAKAKAKLLVYEGTVSGAVADAFSELEGLGSEMREWHDNMPESLQGGSKGEEVSAAADALEGFTEPDCPDVVTALEVKYEYKRNPKKSRRARRDDAVEILTHVIIALEGWLEENEKHDDSADVDTFRDEVQTLIDDAEGVDFPGMY